jgi:regulatory protein
VTDAPGIVTALVEHPRRRGRFVVFLDGIECGLLGVEAIAELGLAVGRPVAAADRAALERAVRRTTLLDKALDLLASRARSTADLRQRLRRQATDEGDVAWVLDRLTSLGYLDDAAFARQLARSRAAGGGFSRRRVQDELFRHGVARETGREALDEVFAAPELDEGASALRAARKRLPSLARLDPVTRRRRLYGWLARRGYESDVIASVLRTLLSDAGDGPEDEES